MTIIGVFVGGYLVNVMGIMKALIISGFLQIFSNLLYVLLNSVGPEINYLFLTVAEKTLLVAWGLQHLWHIYLHFVTKIYRYTI